MSRACQTASCLMETDEFPQPGLTFSDSELEQQRRTQKDSKNWLTGNEFTSLRRNQKVATVISSCHHCIHRYPAGSASSDISLSAGRTVCQAKIRSLNHKLESNWSTVCDTNTTSDTHHVTHTRWNIKLKLGSDNTTEFNERLEGLMGRKMA